jgi:hypothetical protein
VLQQFFKANSFFFSHSFEKAQTFIPKNNEEKNKNEAGMVIIME